MGIDLKSWSCPCIMGIDTGFEGRVCCLLCNAVFVILDILLVTVDSVYIRSILICVEENSTGSGWTLGRNTQQVSMLCILM